MSSGVPGWPFSVPDPPADMKALAIEMQQLTIALSEAGFSPDHVLEHVKYQLMIGVLTLRQQRG